MKRKLGHFLLNFNKKKEPNSFFFFKWAKHYFAYVLEDSKKKIEKKNLQFFKTFFFESF